jgi:nanoRNase/pAp phosphatase (c-di-AMP/oligoRNAs hydrolase)
VKQELGVFKKMLLENTRMIGKVAFSDLRNAKDLPRGNNYLVCSLFPGAITSVRLMPIDEEDNTVKISVGHNIYGQKSGFDVGAAMKGIGGGGHRPVGGATVKADEAEAIAIEIIRKINELEKG